MAEYSVISFYRFFPRTETQVAQLDQELHSFAKEHDIKGLVVLATEGINSTLAGKPEAVAKFKEWIRSKDGFSDLVFKDSESAHQPFRKFRTSVRPEIVTWGFRQATDQEIQSTLLTPTEWNQRFQGDSKPVVIDVRNKYEIELGKFKGAVDPETDIFTEFPKYVEQANLPKDKEVLMYCTGGIRCEKALGYLLDKGYSNVRQLSGGILKYMEEFPNGAFEGECFVFDHRVSVDQQLNPSQKYGLCPHCGNPASSWIECEECHNGTRVCDKCLSHMGIKACSKNCAYHINRKTLSNAKSL